MGWGGREGGIEETHIHCGVDRPSHRARLPALCAWYAGARRAGMRQVRDEGVGEASSLTVGAVERLGRTSQRGAGRTEGSGKQIYQSTDLGGGVKCGCSSSEQSPCPKAPTLSPLPATLLGLQASPATVQSQAGALRRASSGQAWRGWVQEVAESRRQVKAAVHRARPALWIRHKA